MATLKAMQLTLKDLADALAIVERLLRLLNR